MTTEIKRQDNIFNHTTCFGTHLLTMKGWLVLIRWSGIPDVHPNLSQFTLTVLHLPASRESTA